MAFSDILGATAGDLFGDASDISSDEDDKPGDDRRSRSGDERMSGDEVGLE
jgi:hypothetical protein